MAISIELPATLTAEYTRYDTNWLELVGPGEVIVRFGNVEVIRLPAIKEPASHYDTELDRQAEDGVAQETVAKWLREKLG